MAKKTKIKKTILSDAPNPYFGKPCNSKYCIHNEKLFCDLKLDADECDGYTIQQ